MKTITRLVKLDYWDGISVIRFVSDVLSLNQRSKNTSSSPGHRCPRASSRDAVPGPEKLKSPMGSFIQHGEIF